MKHTHTTDEHVPSNSAAQPRTLLDPICGMRVDPVTARGGSLAHAGVEYAFCSTHCRTEFEAHPASDEKALPRQPGRCCCGPASTSK